MKILSAIILNLVIGNLILWIFEMARQQNHLDFRWILGFSSAAIVLLTIAFCFIKSNQSLIRSSLLAGGVSFLTPAFGLIFSFLNLNSLNSTLNGLLIGVILGPMLWAWSLPMFGLNLFLFHWLSRKA